MFYYDILLAVWDKIINFATCKDNNNYNTEKQT